MKKSPFFTCLFVLAISIALVTLISRRGTPIVIQTNLERLPMTIAGFRATEDNFPQSVYKELNADKHIYRHYRSRDGKQVDLYIGYYGTAKGGRTGHNPYACLPGAGWGIIDTRQVTVKSKRYPKGVNVNYILSRKGEVYEVVFHWYQTRGDIVLPNGIAQNIQRFIGRIFYNRNDGAFVRISATCNESGIGKAVETCKLFTSKILDLLPEYWPEERDAHTMSPWLGGLISVSVDTNPGC